MKNLLDADFCTAGSEYLDLITRRFDYMYTGCVISKAYLEGGFWGLKPFPKFIFTYELQYFILLVYTGHALGKITCVDYMDKYSINKKNDYN